MSIFFSNDPPPNKNKNKETPLGMAHIYIYVGRIGNHGACPYCVLGFFFSSVHPWMRHMTINLQCISAFTAAELLSIALHGGVQDFS